MENSFKDINSPNAGVPSPSTAFSGNQPVAASQIPADFAAAATPVTPTTPTPVAAIPTPPSAAPVRAYTPPAVPPSRPLADALPAQAPAKVRSPQQIKRLAKRAGVILLILLLVGGGGLTFWLATIQSSQKSSDVASSFNPVNISLSDLQTGEGLNLLGTRSLNVNGTLRANESFVISPSAQPSNANAGQIYYDGTTNQLSYYNGTQFVPIAAQLASGNGVTVANNQVNNTGVLSLQGQTGAVTLTGGAGITISGTTINSSGVQSLVAGTANLTIATDGAGNLTISSLSGGGTVSSPGGTAGRIAKFTGVQTLEDSLLSETGTTVTVNGDLAVTGSLTLGAPLGVSQGGTGATSLTNNGVLIGQGSGSITAVTSAGAGLCFVSTAGAPTFASCSGGAAVASLNGLTGVLTIANAVGSGSTITINDATTGSKGIASFNSTNFSVSGGAVNTIQNINVAATPTFGALTLSSSQATSPMLLVNNTNAGGTGNLIDLQLNGSSRLALSPAGNMTLTGTINGQTISSAANFTGTLGVSGNTTVGGTLTVNTITPTSTLTVGSNSQTLTLQGNASTSLAATSGANTTTVNFQAPTANVTYRFLTAAAGTYDVCTTAGNCSGTGGVTSPGGTTNRLAKFTGAQTIADSIITDNGTTVTIGGVLAVNTITPSAAMTVGSTTQNLTLQGATTTLSSTSGADTNTLAFAAPTGGSKTITIPNITGTICLDTGNCLGGGGGGANTALSNLTGVAINTSLLPGVAGAIDVGSGSLPIRDLYMAGSSGTPGTNNFRITGASTAGTRTLTLPDASGTFCISTNNCNYINLQSSTPGTQQTGHINVSGTIVAGTNLQAPLVNTADSSGVTTSALTVRTGNVTGGSALSTGALTLKSGDGSGTNTSSGVVVIDSGAKTGSGTTGTLTIGGTNASAIGVGNTGAALTLQGNGSTSLAATSGANTTSLIFQTPIANVNYRLPAASAGTYDICTSAGNCTGTGGGVTTSGGTANRLAKFSAAQAINDSTITDDGSTVTTSVNMVIQGGSATVGVAGSQTGSLVLAYGGASFSGTLVQGALTGNRTYTLPDASGTVCLSSGNCSGSGSNATLQAAYDAGNTIATTDARDVSITLANTTTDANFAISVATGSTGFASITRADGAGTADPAQLLLVSNLDTDRAQPVGIKVQSASGGLTTAIDASGANITNALSVGSNAIVGTTANLTFSNFTVAGATGNTFIGGTLGANGATTLSSTLGVTGTTTLSGDLAANGNTTIGNATTDTLTLASTIQGGTPMVFEGATADANKLSLSIAALTSSHTITLPDETGTVCLQNSANCGFLLGSGTAFVQGGNTLGTAANFGTNDNFGVNVRTNGVTRMTIDTSGNATLTGDMAVNGGDITSTGALNITPGGALTVGVAGQTLTLQGNATTTLAATDSGSTTTFSFQTPTANVTYRLLTATAGTYDICTTVGNCVGSGGGVSTLGGTTGKIAKFTGAQTIGDSLLSESGAIVTVAGNLNLTTGNQFQINGTQIASSNLSNDANLAKLNATQTFTGATNTFQNTSDSTNAFAVQNTGGNKILSVDTTGAQVVLGQASTLGGKLVFANSTNGNTVTLVPGTPSANRTLTMPDVSGVICTDSGNCNGAGGSLQTSYNNSPGTTTPEIKLDATRGAVDIQDANSSINANLLNVRASNGSGLGSILFGVGSTGQTTFQNSVDSTTALNVLNGVGRNILVVDTAGSKVTLGNITSTAAQGVAGSLVFADGTNDNFGLTLLTSTLSANRTITFPNETGTVCTTGSVCTGYAPASGSGNYIQNGTSQQASSNFNISNTGIAGVSFLTPLLDTATAGILAIGTTNATGISLNQNTTVAAGRTLTVTSALTSLTGATTGDALNVSNSTSTGNIALFKDNATTVASIADGGLTTFQNSADVSTGAFRVLNSTGGELVNTNTIDSILTLLGNNTGKLQTFTANTNTLVTARDSADSVFLNGYAYLFGGCTTAVVQYAKLNGDGSTGAWANNTANLPTSACNGAATTYNGYIYVNGGGSNATNSQQVYYGRPGADGIVATWNTAANTMPQDLSHHRMVAYNGYLYAMGGQSNAGTLTQNLYYSKLNADGSPGAWTTVSTWLPAVRRDFGISVANGYLYVVGGRMASAGAGQTTVYFGKLNADGSIGTATPATNALPSGRGDNVSFVLNGYLYSLGGAATGSTQTNLLMYAAIGNDGQPGTWTSDTTAAFGGAGYGVGGVGTYNGYMYYIGGVSAGSAKNTVFYTTGARLKVGGGLDLVGLSGEGMADGGTGGSLNAGNTNIAGTLNVIDNAVFKAGASISGALNVSGSAGVQTLTNATSALAVANSDGVQLLNVGTIHNTADMVANGSIEVNETGWSGRGSGTIARTTAQSLFGNASMQVTGAGASDGAKYTVSLANSIQYSASFYAKLSSGTFTDMIMGYSSTGAAGGEVDCATNQVVLTGGWTKYNCTFTTPGSQSGSPYFYMKAGAIGGAHVTFIDGLQITPSADIGGYYDGKINTGSAIFNGLLSVQNDNNSTNSLAVYNSSGVLTFNVDTVNNAVKIGGGDVNTNATPGLLVLDHKTTSGDPTGVAGALYYNSANSVFRCYQGSRGWTDCLGVPKPNTRKWAYIVYPGSGATFDLNGDIVGGNVANAVAATTTEPGMLEYATAATTNSASSLEGNANYNSSNNPSFQTYVAIPVATNVRVWAGLTDQTAGTMSASGNPAGNYAAFRFDTGGDTNYKCITKNGTTQTVTDSGIAPGTAGRKLEVTVVPGTSAVFKIDGVTVCTNTTNLPAASTMMRYIHTVTALTNSAVSIRVGWIYIDSDK